jgi:hypothetical protein
MILLQKGDGVHFLRVGHVEPLFVAIRSTKRFGRKLVPRDVAMDLKGLGYLVSTVSVGFLGAVAWPSPDEPRWKMWALIAGMATSVAGMAVRFLSHRQDRHDIQRAAADEPPKH